MRVALVTYGLHVGGMESLLFAWARGLRRFGWEVEFIVTEARGDWYDRPAEEGFATRDVLPSPFRGRREHAARVALGLSAFDAVVLNHSRAALASLGLLSDRITALSVLHNDNELVYRFGLANQPSLDRIVCVSPRVHAEALRRGAPESKTRLIVSGVPVGGKWPKAGDTPEHRPMRVAFIGRVEHHQKGVLDLPRILARAAELGCLLRFDMIGDGPDLAAVRSGMSARCAGLDVRCHGALSHPAAMEILSQSDVLLMPSRFEGLPIVLLEAIARGVVPVASLLVGSTDVIVEDSRSGLLLPPGDLEAFAAALVKLSDPAVRREMSRQAWATALERFSEKRMCEQYAELIQEAIADRRAGRAGRRTGRLDPSLFGVEYHLPPVVLAGARRVVRAGRAMTAMWAGRPGASAAPAGGTTGAPELSPGDRNVK